MLPTISDFKGIKGNYHMLVDMVPFICKDRYFFNEIPKIEDTINDVHPDKHRSENTGISNHEATEKFQEFNNAYDYLMSNLA